MSEGPGPPRVLIDLSVAPPGGANTYAAGFIGGLVRADLDDVEQLVVVVDQAWAEAHPEPVAQLRAAGLTVDPLAFPTAGTWRARLLRGRVLRRAAQRHQVDVAYFPREVVPRTGRPHVLLANNLYAWETFSSSTAVGGTISAILLRRIAHRSAARARAVLAVSQVLADAMPDDLHVTAVVHHGCDLPELDRSDRAEDPTAPRRVAMVGNLIRNKGIEVAIEGVAQAGGDGSSWLLEVYGNVAEAAYAAELDELAGRHLGGSVLVGPAYGDDLIAAYARADVVVMGGSFESFCFPLVEAMRSGCVVVAPECALVSEICGDVAVTYREGDASSLADALAQGWERRRELGPAGVERSRAFTWERAAVRTLELVRAPAVAR